MLNLAEDVQQNGLLGNQQIVPHLSSIFMSSLSFRGLSTFFEKNITSLLERFACKVYCNSNSILGILAYIDLIALKEVFKVRQSHEKNLSYLIDFYVKKHFDGLDITIILPFTTIQRIFNNREVRKLIGLDTSDESTQYFP